MPLNRDDISKRQQIEARMVEETGITPYQAIRIFEAMAGILRAELKRGGRVYFPQVGWFKLVGWLSRGGIRPRQAAYAKDPQRRFIKGPGIAIRKRPRKKVNFQLHRDMKASIMSGVVNEKVTLAWLRSKLVEPPEEPPEEPPASEP